MFRAFGTALLLLVGCEQHDYGVQVQAPTAGHGVLNFPETISASFDISIDVAFQRTNFGQEVSRCQFQVAMYYYYQSDGLGDSAPHPEPEDGEQEGPDSNHIDHPTNPGQCVFSAFSEQPGGQPEGGVWQVRGSIDAGDKIALIGLNQDLELTRTVDGEGRVFYDLDSCDEGAFPFNELFDLSAPEANMGSDFEVLYLSEAIATGPQIEITAPGVERIVDGRVHHDNSEDLELVWVQHGELLEHDSIEIRNEKMVYGRNVKEGEHRPFEALACMPSTDDSMLITSEDLQRLTPNLSDEHADYYTAIQVDSQTTLGAVETPWGQLLHARSVITDGGMVHLVE